MSDRQPTLNDVKNTLGGFFARTVPARAEEMADKFVTSVDDLTDKLAAKVDANQEKIAEKLARKTAEQQSPNRPAARAFDVVYAHELMVTDIAFIGDLWVSITGTHPALESPNRLLVIADVGDGQQYDGHKERVFSLLNDAPIVIHPRP